MYCYILVVFFIVISGASFTWYRIRLSPQTEKMNRPKFVLQANPIDPKLEWQIDLYYGMHKFSYIFDRSTMVKWSSGNSISNVFRIMMHHPKQCMAAIKNIRYNVLDKKFVHKEIINLAKVGNHDQVVEFFGYSCGKESAYLVFEFMPYDLRHYLREAGEIRMDQQEIKKYGRQLFKALDHLNSRNVIHLDLKSENLLMIPCRGILKLADFGNATEVGVHNPSEQVTLHYRPPELIYFGTYYTTSIDWWSAGCIIGEMCTNKVLIKGNTIVDQEEKIVRLLGTPTEHEWHAMRPTRARTNLEIVGKLEAELHKRNIPNEIACLIKNLLKYDPSSRMSPAQVLDYL